MTTTAPAPSPLRNWLAGSLFALLAFGACWTGAIVSWRSRAGDPGIGELTFFLLVLPGALLAAALVMRKRLADTPRAPAGIPARTSHGAQASAPAAAVLPLALLAAAVRSPHGASVEEIVDALAGNKARPTLDATLVDDDSFPLMTARCTRADDAALKTDLEAWLAASALPAQFSDEPERALLLATQVVAELAGKAVAALAPQEGEAPLLHLAPVLPRDWSADQRAAAIQWLTHTVAQSGWPEQRIVLVPPSEADLFSTVPAALLAQLATRVPGAQVTAMLVACASNIGEATVQDWTASRALFTSSHSAGQVPGEGAIGLLLTDVAQATTSDGGLFAVVEPVASARLATSADDHRGPLPPALADLVQGALAAAQLQADALVTIVADTGPRRGRMLELMDYAGKAAPQLDHEKEVVPLGRASGVCGAVPALTALALARHYACESNGPVLWLTNDDPFQRCAAVVRPPPVA